MAMGCDMAKALAKPITWTAVRVKLGDLVPWEHNPRQSTKAQAQRILASFNKFGQVQTVAVDPDLAVLDGHQRLSALLVVYGRDYCIDARQSSRKLTEDERKELVLMLHTGAAGSYDWDQLSNWDASLLQSSGFDADYLAQLNREQAALIEILGSESPVEFKEYDESAADDVEMMTCPHCGKDFPR